MRWSTKWTIDRATARKNAEDAYTEFEELHKEYAEIKMRYEDAAQRKDNAVELWRRVCVYEEENS